MCTRMRRIYFGALLAGREADRLETEVRRGIDMWVTRVLDAAKLADSASAAGS